MQKCPSVDSPLSRNNHQCRLADLPASQPRDPGLRAFHGCDGMGRQPVHRCKHGLIDGREANERAEPQDRDEGERAGNDAHVYAGRIRTAAFLDARPMLIIARAASPRILIDLKLAVPYAAHGMLGGACGISAACRPCPAPTSGPHDPDHHFIPVRASTPESTRCRTNAIGASNPAKRSAIVGTTSWSGRMPRPSGSPSTAVA